jgi:hypothetical protein
MNVETEDYEFNGTRAVNVDFNLFEVPPVGDAFLYGTTTIILAEEDK